MTRKLFVVALAGAAVGLLPLATLDVSTVGADAPPCVAQWGGYMMSPACAASDGTLYVEWLYR